MEYFFLMISTLDSTLRVATPLILCSMAGIFSERSGIIDIGLEGKMLASAFAAGSMAFVSGSAWIGLIAGISISMFASLIHAFACVTHRGDQVISGLAINILASGHSDGRFGAIVADFGASGVHSPIREGFAASHFFRRSSVAHLRAYFRPFSREV